jgi:hypothetical protein
MSSRNAASESGRLQLAPRGISGLDKAFRRIFSDRGTAVADEFGTSAQDISLTVDAIRASFDAVATSSKARAVSSDGGRLGRVVFPAAQQA